MQFANVIRKGQTIEQWGGYWQLTMVKKESGWP
jgi:hypothetical protein